MNNVSYRFNCVTNLLTLMSNFAQLNKLLSIKLNS
jgi:hypothetical protein